MRRNFFDYILISLKGMAMGAADVVPGVSGGTIAFISGIYEELIDSISKINLGALKILRKEGFASFWKHINGSFFLALFLGIGISVFSLAKGIKWLLANEPISVWSFFFGLMVACILFLAKSVEKWSLATILVMIVSFLAAYGITTLPPLGSHDGLIFLFFAGALAICAMILPGISGAFILVLLGAYDTVLTAVDEKNIKVLAVVAAGAVFGLLSFSKILKWLFEYHRNLTIASLTAFIVGSLNKVWPWKEVISTKVDAHGKVIPLLEKSVLPGSYDGNPQVILAIVMALAGFFLLYGIEKWAGKLKTNP
ncbi:DUF368 domain-containing protein [Capnocytophaga stomatis]|uniref:DUF368 domain-containing protein n=1 Tax=Capnocytophaga stomatis TaxID=1848904 RepID=A0ABW8Q8S4_9FLAO|nr:DUF368 domain-containing protein [Capnocytophaga stomatis]GIJ94046.1 DUF368 domain-containing protein [Capnocytophaga stomatis]